MPPTHLGKGASREQHMLPCKGHHGLDFRRGDRMDSGLYGLFLPLSTSEESPLNQSPSHWWLSNQGCNKGCNPRYTSRISHPFFLFFCEVPASCIHLLGSASMPRSADGFEHICSLQKSLLELAPSKGWDAELRVPHHQKMRCFYSV